MASATSDIVIVGGGLAGLTAALRLVEGGRTVRLYEDAPTLGGRVYTTKHDDAWLVERGPAAILDDAPATHALIESLGLTSQVVYADPLVKRRYVFLDGKMQPGPSSPPALLASKLLSLGAKLRVAREALMRPRVDASDESMAAFFRRHFGDEITTRLVDAIQSGIYAGDIETLSAHATFPLLVELERTHGSIVRGMIARQRARKTPAPRLMTLRGGLQTLVAALHARLRAQCTTNHRVLDLSTLMPADQIILATPAFNAAPLVKPLDEQLAATLASIDSVPMACVTLGFRAADVTHPLDGFGMLAPRGEGLPFLGVIFTSSLFPDLGVAPAGHVQVRVMMGGAHDRGVAKIEVVDDWTLRQRAFSSLRPILGLRAEPVFIDVVRWPRAIDQYAIGHLDRVRTIEERGRALPTPVHFIGSSYRGVGVNDVIRQGAELAATLLAA